MISLSQKRNHLAFFFVCRLYNHASKKKDPKKPQKKILFGCVLGKQREQHPPDCLSVPRWSQSNLCVSQENPANIFPLFQKMFGEPTFSYCVANLPKKESPEMDPKRKKMAQQQTMFGCGRRSFRKRRIDCVSVSQWTQSEIYAK